MTLTSAASGRFRPTAEVDRVLFAGANPTDAETGHCATEGPFSRDDSLPPVWMRVTDWNGQSSDRLAEGPAPLPLQLTDGASWKLPGGKWMLAVAAVLLVAAALATMRAGTRQQPAGPPAGRSAEAGVEPDTTGMSHAGADRVRQHDSALAPQTAPWGSAPRGTAGDRRVGANAAHGAGGVGAGDRYAGNGPVRTAQRTTQRVVAEFEGTIQKPPPHQGRP